MFGGGEKTERLYEIYQREGITGSIQAILRYIRHKADIKRNLEYLINKLRPSTSIWERDWDICCILDGCRYDTFEEVWDQESERIRSIASTSRTWVSQTFNNIDKSSVAYISANPYSNRLKTGEFAYFHLESVRRTEYGIETVPPKSLADRTIDVWRNREQYGVDKIVVHFMQPHVPFRNHSSLFEEFLGTGTWGSKVWLKIDSDNIDREQFFQAYQDNLEWVLDEGFKPIKQNCDATIALTADHGNAAGEWGYYGHRSRAPVSSVRVVPWAIIEGTDQSIHSPDIEHKQEEINIDEQLRALGYK